MDDIKQEKIKRFMNDEVMNKAVREVILSAFLDDLPSTDVNTLAASRLAIYQLNGAWERLSRYKSTSDTPQKEHVNNVGL